MGLIHEENNEQARTNVANDSTSLTSQKGTPTADETHRVNGENAVAAEEPMYPTGFRLVLIAGASIMGVFLISLDQTILGTAIPRITDEFGGLSDVSWYSAAYFMTFGGLEASWGKAFKYFDIKWTFVFAMFIFEIGSLLCGVAPNSNTLIGGRVIAGVGAAGISVGGVSIISFSVPPRLRPAVMGSTGLTYGLAAVLGPLIGVGGWRWCFYINLPIGGLAMVILLLFFQLPAAGKPPAVGLKTKLLHLDPVGVMLTMGAIICFILGLQDAGSTLPWNDSRVIGLLVGFVALSAALVFWSIYLDEYAMMIPRLFKMRTLWSVCPYQLFYMGDLMVLMYYLPIYFQSIKGANPIQSGVDILPTVISVGILCILGGVVVAKTGRPVPLMFVSAAIATVGCGLLYTLDIDTSTDKWIGYQILVSSAIAFSVLMGMNITQANVGHEDLAAATANLVCECLAPKTYAVQMCTDAKQIKPNAVFQTVGGAFTISSAQAAFINQMLSKLAESAPGIDGATVIATGATQLREVFTAEELPGVLVAYMHGIKAAFAVSVGFAGLSFLSTLLMPWGKLPSHTADGDKKDAPMVMMA
ncbi:putative HC-toxin efflux carrier TOXA [Seiridium unicorne]|uniref:HC-toxin efflux carrier TOXA n=1 Tax=Seiridium unicorne TaxID=138068 RepID=A0ABR2UJ55_9PEZI